MQNEPSVNDLPEPLLQLPKEAESDKRRMKYRFLEHDKTILGKMRAGVIAGLIKWRDEMVGLRATELGLNTSYLEAVKKLEEMKKNSQDPLNDLKIKQLQQVTTSAGKSIAHLLIDDPFIARMLTYMQDKVDQAKRECMRAKNYQNQ